MRSVLRFWDISKADMDTLFEGANSCITGVFGDLIPSPTHLNSPSVVLADEDLWADLHTSFLKILSAIKQPLIRARKNCLDIFLDTGIFVSDLHDSVTKITLTPALLKLLSELGLLQMLTVYNDIMYELTDENVELTSNMPSFYSTSLVFEKTSNDSMDAIIAESERSIPWLKLSGKAFRSPEQENTYIIPIGGGSDYYKAHEVNWLLIRRAQSMLSLAKQLSCEPHITFTFNLSENERLMTEVYWSRYFMQELAELNMHLTFQIISDTMQRSHNCCNNKLSTGHSRSQTKILKNRHRRR